MFFPRRKSLVFWLSFAILYDLSRVYCSAPALKSLTPGEESPVKEAENGDIVGGNATELKLVRFMAGIVQDGADGWEHICSAVIISQNWVLTAAHCFGAHSQYSQRYLIYYNTVRFDLDREEQRIARIDKIFMHEEFDRLTAENDIALVKLERRLDFMYESVDRIQLNVREPIFYNQTVEIYGYGDGSDVMQTATVQVESHRLCQELYRKKKEEGYRAENLKVTGSHFCMRADVADGQNGDSGSPAVITKKVGKKVKILLAGISSFGEPQHDKNKVKENSKPGVYIDVRFYIEWIKRIIFENTGCDSPDIARWEFMFADLVRERLGDGKKIVLKPNDQLPVESDLGVSLNNDSLPMHRILFKKYNRLEKSSGERFAANINLFTSIVGMTIVSIVMTF